VEQRQMLARGAGGLSGGNHSPQCRIDMLADQKTMIVGIA
jgi:hypothetical protein